MTLIFRKCYYNLIVIIENQICTEQNRTDKVKRFLAFTLAEVLITLGIIGVIAAVTIPTLIQTIDERQYVSALKKHYSVFSEIILRWQSEKGCVGNIANCISPYAAWDCESAFDDIFKDKLMVQARRNRSEAASGLDWLPSETKQFNSNTAYAYGMFVVSQNTSYDEFACQYQLQDGATMTFVIKPFDHNYGYIAIDINGKKSPNRQGKDTFFIGIGAPNNPKYTGINPYFNYENDDNPAYGGGQCNIRNAGDTCNPDDGLSPTAYVLMHDKLPDTKALFGN